ncbi:MAG: chemotaxis protein CheW [Bdellovibrionales bacterium]|jgi:purine-binding chemotaxis protein CheW|nr:chemotaxis protein CheW [Bdellovibrionales bacterium]
MSQHEKSARARQVDTNERYLAFQLGTEQYAIPLLQVKEVIEMNDPTPIPQTPTYFKGVINLRGQVISVLDLRLKLQLPKIENGPKTAIIILDLDEDLCMGVIVDRINSVLAFPSENISPAPDNMTGKEQYLTGVARRDGKMTLILNVHSVLNIQDLGAARVNQNQKQVS